MSDKSFMDTVLSAWNKMLNILFNPFEWDKWIIISFAAWLTLLSDDFSTLLNLFNQSLSFLQKTDSNSINISMLIIGLLALALPASIILLWIMSKGEFVYLDKLLNKDAKIGEAWKKYSSLGNSVFFWWMFFTIALLAVYAVIIAISAALCFNWVYSCIKLADIIHPDPLVWVGIAFFTLSVLVIAFITTVIFTIFKNLAIPLMYKDNIKAFKAFRIVFNLLITQPGKMIEYLLVLIVLKVIYFAAFTSLAIITCCIFSLITAIPFIGTAVLLPVITFFRFFNLEYLAMFGEEYNVLKQLEK